MKLTNKGDFPEGPDLLRWPFPRRSKVGILAHCWFGRKQTHMLWWRVEEVHVSKSWKQAVGVERGPPLSASKETRASVYKNLDSANKLKKLEEHLAFHVSCISLLRPWAENTLCRAQPSDFQKQWDNTHLWMGIVSRRDACGDLLGINRKWRQPLFRSGHSRPCRVCFQKVRFFSENDEKGALWENPHWVNSTE